jgi:hypothetical protein
VAREGDLMDDEYGGRGSLSVWRVLSWKYLGGGYGATNLPFKRQYMFDELVAKDRLFKYLDKIMEERGVEYIKLEKKGTLKFVMDNNLNPEPRPGAQRLSRENLNHKLEDFNA